MVKRTVEKTAGMYYLQGVKETASGFKLVADGTFQFFFTYGALDRYGSGTWALEDSHVILQSRPWGGRDFAPDDSRTISDNQVTLRIVGGNPLLLRHVYFSLQNGETGTWVKTNESGEAIFPLQQVNNISIVFEFCPERFTHFKIDTPQHNYYEFRFEQWLMEVFFDKFTLLVEKYALGGKHPLMKGEKYVYEKG
jgi:hypothetical protein